MVTRFISFFSTRSFTVLFFTFRSLINSNFGIIAVCAQSCLTLCNPLDLQPTRHLSSWSFPGKNTRVGYHFPLQEIFLTQGSNPWLLHLPYWQVNCLPLHHLESPELSVINVQIEFLGSIFFSPCQYSTFLLSLFLGLSFLPLNFSGTFVKADLITYVQEYF